MEKLIQEQKQQNINAMWCKEIMQCSEQNKWLQKNNVSVIYTLEKDLDSPHFGSVRHSNNDKKMVQQLMHCVY